MPKFKVEFSNSLTTLPEHGLDFPNVETAPACKGVRDIANKLRADGIFTFGFSDWRMTIMDEDGTRTGRRLAYFHWKNTKKLVLDQAMIL